MTADEIKTQLLDDCAKYHHGYLTEDDLRGRLWELATTAYDDESRPVSLEAMND